MADTKISAATLTTPQTTDLIPLARGGSSVARHATVAALVQAQAASTTAVGSVELATAAETRTGTSSSLAVTPAGLAAVNERVYSAVGYGATPGSDSTAAIQAAMDAAGAAGGGIVVVEPSASAYLLTTAGTHTGIANHKYCLKFNYDNICLEIQPGATLKLADAQQADGAPVDVIIGTDRTNIRIYGGGTITGNTAGQTGWSGGYAQVVNGCLIYFWGTNGNGNHYITVEDLLLTDCFSNPVDISGYAAYEATHIRFRNLVCSAFGEGVSISLGQYVHVENITLIDAGTTQGDGVQVELSNEVVISGIRAYSSSGLTGGSAIETAGSKQVVVDNVIVDGWAGGMSIQNASWMDTQDISVSNSQFLNIVNTGLEIIEWGDTYSAENITLNGLVFRSCTVAGIYIAYNTVPVTGPVTIIGCEATGCGYGLTIAGAVKNLSIIGGKYNANTNGGLVYGFGYGTATAADTANLYISGVVARGNGTYGIEFQAAGTVDRFPTGVVSNCACEGNSTGAFVIASTGLVVENMTPNATTGISGSTIICGYRYFTPSGTPIATFLYPSAGQVLIIRFAVDTWQVIDKSQSGGNNIRLVGGVNFVPAVGNRLCLEYDEVASEWVELWRRIN